MEDQGSSAEFRKALERLAEQQRETERRLARIEEALSLKAAGRLDARPAEPPPQPTAPLPPPPRTVFETRMGLTWINRTGVITLVLGVAFFFKYAVDNRWIGETGRVLIGASAGLVALALADLLWRRGQATFSHGVSGAGIAILYVSCFAAYGYYSLLPHVIAFALMLLITVAAGGLALRYGSPAMAALGLAGGYLTPVVLETSQGRPWVLLSYTLVLTAGALAVAGPRGWRRLELLAFAFAQALFWFSIEERATAVYVFALIFYALFASRSIRAVFAAAQVLALLQIAVTAASQPLPFLPLAVLITAAGLAVADWRGWPEAPAAVLAAFWLAYGCSHAVLTQHAAPLLTFGHLTLVFALFLGWLSRRALARGGVVQVWELLLVPTSAALYFGASWDLLSGSYGAWIGALAVLLAAAHLAAGGLVAARSPASPAARVLLGVGICFLTAAAPLEFAGYRVTMAWTFEAAALAWIGARTREVRLVYASLAVYLLVLARLATVDRALSPQTVLWNVRFLTFAAAAAALWLAARWISLGLQALAPYAAGHAVMLGGLCLELYSWISRHASAADVRNARGMSLSVLGAAYAVLLVARGVAARSAADRILGLGLMGIVVLKLYLYDVWRIDRGMYRVAAFAGLGVCLLAMSYLYSRHRASIENWWRELKSRS